MLWVDGQFRTSASDLLVLTAPVVRIPRATSTTSSRLPDSASCALGCARPGAQAADAPGSGSSLESIATGKQELVAQKRNTPYRFRSPADHNAGWRVRGR